MVGTFFTIASWNFLERYSEVNTMVRLGNGYPSAERTGYEPVAIEPFIITLRMDEGEVRVELSEHLQLDVNGQIIDLNDDGRPIDQCGQQSDSYLRANYWYYLNNAVLLDYQTLTTNIRQYSLLTYSNRVGTFLVISSCEGDQVKANTFVRLGAGSETPDNIVLEPIILQMQPFWSTYLLFSSIFPYFFPKFLIIFENYFLMNRSNIIWKRKISVDKLQK